jgi:hypothetical protein
MADGPKASSGRTLTVALGFTIDIGGEPMTVAPLDVSRIDDGNLTIDLPEDVTRTIPSLRKFYEGVDKLAKDNLPDFPDKELPPAVAKAADAPVTLRRFYLRVEGFSFKELEIDATLTASWTLPETEISVGNPRVILKFSA